MFRVRSLYGIAALSALMTFVLVNGDGKLPFPETEMRLKAAYSDVEPLPKVGISDGKMTLAELDYILSRADLEIEAPETREDNDNSSYGVSLDDAEYLALTIESEAGNVENPNGRVAVGLTVCYRANSDDYPDTARGVVEQPYQYTDLVSRYSEESYDAAVTAITLWEEGASESILPEECMYFFGDGKENWFYRKKAGGGIEIVPVPGQVVTSEVYETYERIVKKKNTTEPEAISEEVADETETVSEEVIDEATEVREGIVTATKEQTEVIGENPSEESVTGDTGATIENVAPQIEGVPTDI